MAVLKEIFASPQLKARALNQLTGNASTKGPYFREKYGMEMLPIVDAIIEDGKPREFRFSEFSCSRNTLYLRIRQGIDYLCAVHDVNKYGPYSNRFRCSRSKTHILLSLAESDLKRDMVAHVVEADIQFKDIMEAIEVFLNDDHTINKRFKQEGLLLDEGDRTNLLLLLQDYPNLIHSVKRESVTIVKLDPKAFQEINEESE